MKNLFPDKDQPHIDDHVADQLLDNILSASGLPPNSVPLSTLRDQANYRKGRFGIQRVIVIAILIVLALFPLLFIHPKMSLVDATSSSPGSSLLYTATMQPTPLPITNVSATLDGIPLQTIKTDKRTYAIQPTVNGTLVVKVTLASGQYDTKEIKVTTNDSTPPAVADHTVTDTSIILNLSDDDSGIDYTSVYGTDANGNTIKPISYDEKKGTVTFAYPETSMNIFVSDNAGNTAQTILTVR